jgi:hypothetical protein
LSLSPASLTFAAGTSTSFQVSLQPLNGFTGTATVQISSLPTGVTVSPGTSISVSSANPQTVTVVCAATVPAGTYSLQLTATSGSLSHSQSEALTVQAPVIPDFALSLNPSSLSLAAGGQGSFQVSFQPSGGFSGSVQIQISGLPANATATPSGQFQLLSSSPQTVTVTAAVALASGSYPLTIAGTSGSLGHSVTETLNVQNSAPPPSRADFVRTDDSPGAAAYDQLHQRVYVANPVAGTVDVISSTTYQILRRIPVPSPAGIDISPDDSTVFIGTSTEAVYALDTATMAMTSRYIAPLVQVNANYSNFQPPVAPVAAPDGTALISLGGQIVKWNPATGQTTTVLANPAAVFGYGPNSPMAHSADHTKVIMSNDDDASTVNVFDTQQNAFLPPLIVKGYAYSVAANPTGTQFVVAAALDAYGGESFIELLDANLNTIASVAGGGNLLYSADGKSIYVVSVLGNLPVVAVLDSTTLALVGTAPSYASNIAYFEREPPLIQETPLVADETGRIFGSADHGLAIDDAADLRPYTGNEVYPIYDIVADPDDGPVNQQQAVQIQTESYPAVPAIWFGPLPASGTSISGSYLATTAPALNQTGPVNIRLDGTDKVQGWIPQAYTYGSALSDGPDIAASASESSTIHLFGYGLGGYDSGGAGTTAAFGSAKGTVSSGQLYPGETSYPFPLWDLQVQTPQVAPGAVDMIVGTTWGSSTRHTSYHAVDMHSYELDGTPYSMAYDATRKQIYIAVTGHIDVFSLSSRGFLSTIQVPTLNKVTQLGGVAITPDGKWLIASNWLDGSVALINPDAPSSAVAIAVGSPPNAWGQGPNQLAATNNGQVFVAAGGQPASISWAAMKQATAVTRRQARTILADSSGPEASVWLLDLQSKTAASFSPLLVSPESPYLAASPDGSQVCFSGLYIALSLYSSTTGAMTSGPGMQGPESCGANASVAAGSGHSGSSGSGGLAPAFNLAMQEISTASLLDYQTGELATDLQIVHGIAIDSTGALVYLPLVNHIALFDSHTGEFREDIALPSPSQDIFNGSILVNETGDQVYVVTGNGLTVIQMDTLPLAVGSIATSGGAWTIAGTGFVSGTAITVDGSPVSVQFTDSQHLQVSSPPDISGMHTLTLVNPDGRTYTYDAAYLR